MAMESLCSVCGNEVDALSARCPFCNEARNPEFDNKGVEQFRVVNLERGMPLVKDALNRLALEFETASRTGIKVLVLVHGYGSSGTGGAIKQEVHRQMQLRKDRKLIGDFLPGEECVKRSGRVRQISKRFPFLKEYLNRPNPGISLVII